MLIAMVLAQALTVPDDTSAHKFLQMHACAGNKSAMQSLALRLATAGDPEGFVGLGWLEETATPSAPTRAFAYYLTAAQRGSLRAQWKVGVMLDTGAGVPVDPKAAAFWFHKAARQKLGAAWSSLGLLRQMGRGVLLDRTGARRAYFRAIRYGEPHGFAGVGALYSSRSDRRSDYLRAIAWYRVAASYDDDIAQGKLAVQPPLDAREDAAVTRRVEKIRLKHPIVIAWDDMSCSKAQPQP